MCRYGRLARAVATIVVGAALVAAPAAGASAWSKPVDLGYPHGLWGAPQIDGTGAVHVLERGRSVHSVRVVSVAADGRITRACRVRGTPAGRDAFLALGVDDRGDTLLAGDIRRPEYWFARPGGCFGRRTRLPHSGFLAFGPGGTFALISSRVNGRATVFTGHSLIAHRAPHSGSFKWIADDALADIWSTTTEIPTPGPGLKFSANWYEAISRPHAGSWGRPVRIFHEVYGNQQMIIGNAVPLELVDDRGDVLLAVDAPFSGLAIVTHRAGAKTTRIQVLNQGDYPGTALTGAIDAEGEAVLAWNDFNGFPTAAFVYPNGRITAPQRLGRYGPLFPASVAIDDRGRAVIAWDGFDVAASGAVYTAVGRAGAFQPAVAVASPVPPHWVGSAQVAVNARGQAALEWTRNTGAVTPPFRLLLSLRRL